MLGLGFLKRKESMVAVSERENVGVPAVFTDTIEQFLLKLKDVHLAITDLSVSIHQQIMKDEAEKLKAIKKGLEKEKTVLESVISALRAGFNPTTPNSEWYCGFARMWWPVFDNSYDDYKTQQRVISVLESFPSKRNHAESKLKIFSVVMPVGVQKKYLEAKKIFGEENIVIYSPQSEDFREIRIIHTDPVMIGRIRNVPNRGDMFFEIVRWGTAEDLKSMDDKK